MLFRLEITFRPSVEGFRPLYDPEELKPDPVRLPQVMMPSNQQAKRARLTRVLRVCDCHLQLSRLEVFVGRIMHTRRPSFLCPEAALVPWEDATGHLGTKRVIILS